MAEHLVVLPAAEADLAEACDWYDSQEPGLSADFLRDVTRLFESIREFPEMFEVVRRHFRRAIAKRFPYVIYFKWEGDRVEVHAVLHGSRSERVWRRRLK